MTDQGTVTVTKISDNTNKEAVSKVSRYMIKYASIEIEELIILHDKYVEETGVKILDYCEFENLEPFEDEDHKIELHHSFAEWLTIRVSLQLRMYRMYLDGKIRLVKLLERKLINKRLFKSLRSMSDKTEEESLLFDIAQESLSSLWEAAIYFSSM